MSAATLASIELALYTALSGLLTNVTTGPTTSRPFACVGRYAGPVPPEGLAEAAAQYPCAMLRFDEDQSTRDVMGFGAASIEDRALSQFSVLVAVEDARATYDSSAAVTIPAVYSDINLVGTGTAPNPLVQIVSDTTP